MSSNVESLALVSERFWSDLHELAELTEPDAPGWTRQVFSEPYRASRDWVRHRMADAFSLRMAHPVVTPPSACR
jgi:N-carbamoyl-L-amino-acid hydrolase